MRTTNLKELLHAFRADRDGNFAILFAAAALPLFVAGGLAVDVTHAFTDRSDMANALDAAVLSTTKALSIGQIQAPQATGYLKKVFAGNLVSSELGKNANITAVTIDGATNTVKAEAAYAYRASFGVFGTAGVFPLTASAAASYGDGTAEVAMTFDLTGSMAGSKIAALRDAANLGVDQLLQANSNGETRIRIAAVPYAAAVNVGPDLVKYVYSDNGDPNVAAPEYDPNTGKAKSKGKTKKTVDTCATERKGDLQASDAAPDQGMINRDGRLPKNGCPDAEIVPLTADGDALHREIRNFTASGTTAGHIGIQWAWYMLSHNWASFMPKDSGAAAADQKLHKYAIIMTDGEFNTAYADVGKKSDVTNQPKKSSDDALALCTAMKADGIEIFTIGFDLDEQRARDTLEACASPDRNGMTFFYNASTGTELSGVYREIAAMIQKLRLVS